MPTYWQDFIDKRMKENPDYFDETPISNILENFFYYLELEGFSLKTEK